MIEGAIMLAELGLFLILLLKVWRVHAKGEENNTGLFAYRVDNAGAADAGRIGNPGRAPDA